jgi:peptide/nickel transport system substrate-binding protein
MNCRKKIFVFIFSFFLIVSFTVNCRTRNSAIVTIALDSKFDSLDFLSASTVSANAERIRSLIFNTLVRKNEKFEYIGELAKDIKDLDGGSTISFTLQDNVKFHNGAPLRAADVKYTFEKMLAAAGSAKASSFFETVGKEKKPHILSIEAPDDKTVNFKLSRPALKNQLLSNMVAIPIIPEGTFESQKDTPVGTGAFKFVKYDTTNNIVDLNANPDYWEGAPKIQQLRVKVIADQNAVQAELKSGQLDIAPMMINLPPDTVESLKADPNLKVYQFNSANVQIITFQAAAPPIDNVKVRQAIAYGIDREGVIKDLLRGQGKLAHSILPEESWAFSTGTVYQHDEAKAKQLLDDAGFKDPDGDGDKMRFDKPIVLSISAGNSALRQYSEVIQNQLKQIGIPVEISTVEFNTLLEQWRLGQFQMTINRWVGGNQDPIFYKDLFLSTESTDVKPTARNRSRYKNETLDKILERAVNEPDKEAAKQLYVQAQDIISRDLPIFPLWYPANVVVANKRIGNIQVDASGDWNFVRNLTVN